MQRKNLFVCASKEELKTYEDIEFKHKKIVLWGSRETSM